MTATRTRPATASSLTGGWVLYWFMLRRDRVRIALWAVITAAFTGGAMSTLVDTYGDAQQREALEATMANPAMVAITGRNYAPGEYTMGVMTGQQMLIWTAITVAIMSILLMVRHTRTEEATGRFELVRAGVVGRYAAPLAAYKAVATANVAVAGALTLALAAVDDPSMGWHGALLYGAAHLATGLVFASITLLLVQVSEYPRGVIGMGLAVLGASFVVRVVGDVAESGLSWLSPLGWAQATHVYHDNRWWPVAIGLLAAVAIAVTALALSDRRDVGAGLKAPKAAPASASRALSRPWIFALRQQRALIVGWTAGLLFLGMSYGSVLGDVESFMDQFAQLQEVFATGDGIEVLDSFVSTIMVVMAVMGAAAAVLAGLRLRTEETEGRLEPLLIAGMSRTRALWAWSVVALGTGAVVTMAGAVGMGIAGAVAVGDSSLVTTAVAAGSAYVPAAWFVSGLTLALVAWVPRVAAWAWALVGYSFVAVYMRGLVGLPEWMELFTPYGYVPRYPADDWQWWPMLVMVVVAAATFVLAWRGWLRRDLQSTT